MVSNEINNASTPTPKGKARRPPPVPKESKELVTVADVLPPNLVLLPVSQTSIFPGMIVPVIIPEGKLTKAIDNVMQGSGYLGVVLGKEEDKEWEAASPSTSMTGLPMERAETSGKASLKHPKPESTPEFCRYGVMAKVLKRINLPDNQVSMLLSGVQRFEIDRVLNREPHYIASVKYLLEEGKNDTEMEALLRSALAQFKQLSKDNPLISEEVKVALVNIDGPGKLADLMASVLVRDVKNYQSFLAAGNIKDRLQLLLLLLRKEQDVQNVQKQIHEEINQKVTAAQKEFYLSEQLKVIQRELGKHSDDKTRLIDKFRKRLEMKTLSEEAKRRIGEEFEKIETLHEQSSEYSVALNYLDWATDIPWGVHTDENFSLRKAREILDEDHYGLKDPKERILEFLAVKKLKKSSEGSILCFVGPPGTGKTSLGKSIARALGRKFFRFSVGGMRDEAEIKGHRRTYVGAMPGKVIQGVKRVGSQNPVFLLDEVDKMGTHMSSGGDPASALLELLDPEQNKEFLDHYLDIPFDCSEVFFITTANTTDTIPEALLDRMEIIPLHSYSDNEKFQIAKKFLIPRQMKKNGLTQKHLGFQTEGIRLIISQYAREAGVRNLEKQIAKICRKVAYRVATGKKNRVSIDGARTIHQFLGQPPFAQELGPDGLRPGVVTGLAWTQMGGEVLYLESVAVEGKGSFTLTGSLGEVMQESASIAYTFAREKCRSLKVPSKFFDKNILHLHAPAGATPKDGPSAGVTMAVSLVSLLANKPVKPKLAMTGELTLSGRILPVGGIKEKLLAAKRNGIKTVILPKANAKEVIKVEPEIRKGLKIHLVSNMSQVLRLAF